jgi:hypothetical protein
MSIQIKRHDVGKTRWHLTIIIDNWPDNEEFHSWMETHCPECMCVRRWNRSRPYWEVRGGDQNQMMMIYMRWAT